MRAHQWKRVVLSGVETLGCMISTFEADQCQRCGVIVPVQCGARLYVAALLCARHERRSGDDRRVNWTDRRTRVRRKGDSYGCGRRSGKERRAGLPPSTPDNKGGRP